MGNGPSKIIPGLYVGGIGDAKDLKRLQQHEITHMVSAHDRAGELHDGEVKQVCIQLSDSPEVDISQHFLPVARFIHAARREKGIVMVHCLAGVSRSVTLVAAYVMLVGNVGWIDALKIIRFSRLGANPNVGFKRQLRDFEAGIEEARRQFRQEFPLDADLEMGLDDAAASQAVLSDHLKRLGFGEMSLIEHQQELMLVEDMLDKRDVADARAAATANCNNGDEEDDGIAFIDSEEPAVERSVDAVSSPRQKMA